MSKVNFNHGMQRWFNMGRYHEQNEEEDNTQSSSTEAEKAVDIIHYLNAQRTRTGRKLLHDIGYI